MRTVHAYTSSTSQYQQTQQQQPSPTMSGLQQAHSSSTNHQNSHQHSSANGFQSVRHSLLRMHSQLRSAPNRRETNQGPIDLSQCGIARVVPKVSTRSTSTTTTSTSTALRTVPIITPLVTAPTHTIYSNAVPSGSSTTTTSTTTSTSSTESNHKNQTSTCVEQTTDFSSSSTTSASVNSPKLAYSYSNIEENLQCPLCIDRLRDPRALPCQHVFCCACLKSIPSANHPYPTIACPLCRRTFPYNGADQFPVSYIHRQLLELVPKNYDINGKCTKCRQKTSLILCSCCDFLLCEKCYQNDREKILDNIRHIVQTSSHRLNRIHNKRNQLNELNDQNRKKIQQVEGLFENFERKFFGHKQTILNSLRRFNEQIETDFWSKLNISSRSTTEPYVNIIQQAESLLEKSQNTSFDDILSLFYNLSSIDEQLAQANSLIDTCDVQNLFKQNIQLSNHDSDEQVQIHLNQINTPEKVLPLIPPSILPRSTKRLRKTEPKRHIEQIEDDDDEGEEEEDSSIDDENQLPITKRVKVECQAEMSSSNSSSPLDPLLFFCSFNPEEQQQKNECNDHDVIYLETIQGKMSDPINFDDLFRIINTPE